MDKLEEMKEKKIKEMMKKSQYPDKPIELTDENFDSTIAKYPLVVIDCWAEWCMPCQMIAPIIKELAKKYQGQIVFGKLDVTANNATATRFKINAIPHLLIFKKDKLVDRIVGVQPKEVLEAKLKQYF